MVNFIGRELSQAPAATVALLGWVILLLIATAILAVGAVACARFTKGIQHP
jgi:hypothetical protein